MQTQRDEVAKPCEPRRQRGEGRKAGSKRLTPFLASHPPAQILCAAARRASGFTLVEILLATVVFVGALFPIYDTFSFSARVASLNREQTQLVTYARNFMELLWGLGELDSLPVGTGKETAGGVTYDYVEEGLSQEATAQLPGGLQARFLVQIGYAGRDNSFQPGPSVLKRVDIIALSRFEGEEREVVHLAFLHHE